MCWQFRNSNRSPSLLVFLGDTLKTNNRRRPPLPHQLRVPVSHSPVGSIAARRAEARAAHQPAGVGVCGVKWPPVFGAAGLPQQKGARGSVTGLVSNNSVARSKPVKLGVSLKRIGDGAFRRSLCCVAGQAGWGTSSPAVEIATKCRHEGCCCSYCCCRWHIAGEDPPPRSSCCCSVACAHPGGSYE